MITYTAYLTEKVNFRKNILIGSIDVTAVNWEEAKIKIDKYCKKCYPSMNIFVSDVEVKRNNKINVTL